MGMKLALCEKGPDGCGPSKIKIHAAVERAPAVGRLAAVIRDPLLKKRHYSTKAF